MPLSHSPEPDASIVDTLRAAGCVFAEDEARLLTAEAQTPADLAAMVDRRAAGLPLEQVLGWSQFCGLRIVVEPGVFVPRRRTEFLVSQAAAIGSRPRARSGATRSDTGRSDARSGPARSDTGRADTARSDAGRSGAASPSARRAVVVDLCCGSGAVGAAVAAALGGAELHAADIDPAAVRCARRNVAQADGIVYQGDLYQALPAELRGRVDVLVANAPYVPTGEVHLLPAEARVHEPNVALDGGEDGLEIVRRVIAGAPPWLAPDGCLVVETSERQAWQAVEAVARAGLIPRTGSSAELGATVVAGAKGYPVEPGG